MRTKPSSELTLHDRLSRLDPLEAIRLLGKGCPRWLARGGAHEIDIASQVEFAADRFRVTVPQVTEWASGSTPVAGTPAVPKETKSGPGTRSRSARISRSHVHA